MGTSRLEKFNGSDSRHLGNLIRSLVKQNGFDWKDVAAYIEVSEEQLSQIFDSRTIDIERLIKFSQLLQHNLFIYYLDNEVIGNLFENYVKEMAPQVSYLIRQLEAKDGQIAQLRALTETQRKIIEILETKQFLQNSVNDE
ncbi:hypothetical protein ACLOAU_04295 [Niabella sp. CJ426]|uniref:hypothetical protein n=1 Tax=Niabella sp. CJ426 TaxID=3393740 RepID=UPI003CFC7648